LLCHVIPTLLSQAYPYSTREAVAVVKHLQLFPDDGVVNTLENVLAFDNFDPQLRKSLAQVFNKNGIPVAETAGGRIEPKVES
jgi:hypothetical protein